MSVRACTAPVTVETLVAYWFGELDPGREFELEEHLFGCEACSAELADVVRLGRGVQRAVRAGVVHVVLPVPFLQRLATAGARVREYRLQPGGSVNCTVAPDDDFVVARLRAPLRDVQRLDLAVEDVVSGTQWRIEDVAFDPAAGEIVLATAVAELRQLGATVQRVRLVALAGAAERELGRYTFNHSPYVAP